MAHMELALQMAEANRMGYISISANKISKMSGVSPSTISDAFREPKLKRLYQRKLAIGLIEQGLENNTLNCSEVARITEYSTKGITFIRDDIITGKISTDKNYQVNEDYQHVVDLADYIEQKVVKHAKPEHVIGVLSFLDDNSKDDANLAVNIATARIVTKDVREDVFPTFDIGPTKTLQLKREI